MTTPRPNTEIPLVGTDWLADQLDAPDLRVFDRTVHLRPATPGPYLIESGRADVERAHIPGAAFSDLGVIVSIQQIDTVAADQAIAGPRRRPGR